MSARVAILVALAAGVGGSLALGSLAGQHESDSLVPVFVSLYRWTPFYWEQNRFGMLVPLLATPLHDPFWNLIVQNWISAACGVGLFLLLPRFFLRDERSAFAGLLAATCFVVVAPADYRFAALASLQPYTVSLALGVGAALAWPDGAAARWTRVRVAVTAAGTLLSAWINTAAPPFLILLWGARYVSRGRWPASWRAAPRDRDLQLGLLLSAVAFLGYRLIRVVKYRPTSAALVGLADGVSGTAALWRNTWTLLGEPWAALATGVAVVALAVGHWWWAGRPSRVGQGLRAAAALGGTAVLYVGFTGSLAWTRANAHAGRYAIPAVFLLFAAVAVCAAPVFAWTSQLAARITFGALVVALVTAVLFTDGLGTPARARDELARSLGGMAPDLLTAGCTHVLGDYGRVWPAVFDANVARWDRGDAEPVWPIAYRSQALETLWRRQPLERWRVCVDPRDESVPSVLEKFRLPRPLARLREGAIEVLTFPEVRVTDGREAAP